MKVDGTMLSNLCLKVTEHKERNSNTESVEELSLAVDSYSKLPLEMHRKVLGHATSKSINRIKCVSHFFRARGEDPSLQAACLARFARRFEPLRQWEQLLRLSVGAPQELLPSDALFATHRNSFRILNPANIIVVPAAQRWFTNARNAALMLGKHVVGYVQYQHGKHDNAQRLIGLHEAGGQMVGFGKIGSIYAGFPIETVIPTPEGLVSSPGLLQDLRDFKLLVGEEYFVVFPSNNLGGKASGLMRVPTGMENCRGKFAERVTEVYDVDSANEDDSIDADG